MSKRILITGGSGFLGKNLALKLKDEYEIVLGSRNNKQNLQAKNLTGTSVIPMDVSNIESVRDAIRATRPHIIIHAAATKFVDLSEKFPLETIDINILGSQNIARAAMDFGVEFVLGISTDKACPPIRNMYGLSKATMERMFCLLDGESKTRFACVRYGNVAWSTGSVFPIWKQMHDATGVIETTGPEMRRFFFTVEDATKLVETAINNQELVRGKVLSRVMKSAKIGDILNVWVSNFGGSWEKVEERPGERNDEYLIGESELDYCESLEILGVTHFLISPNKKSNSPYHSSFSSKEAERLTEKEILNILMSQSEQQ